jgi:hypothetical protein
MRVTQVALLLNAALATVAGIGFIAGALPHAADAPNLAHRVGAAELAGAFIMIFVATRLRRDASLLVLPAAFVVCNLVASIHEVATSRAASDLPPLLVEALFVAIYTTFFVRSRAR